MKIKKETFEKIMLGILTFILIVYIIFSLCFLCLYNISEKFLNKKNVTDFISDINIIDVLKDELGSEFNQITLIEEELTNIGITEEGLTEFMNSEDVKQFNSDLLNNIFSRISNDGNYQINTNEVNELIEKNIDELQSHSELSKEQIKDKLNSKLPNLIEKMNKVIDKICDKLENSEKFTKYQNYLYMSINLLDIIYSDIVCALIIFILITFIALLVFIRKNIYKSLKWLTTSFIIPSILLFTLGCIISNIKIDSVLVNNILDIVIRKLNGWSLIYTSIAVVFIVINLIMYMVKDYKSKKARIK